MSLSVKSSVIYGYAVTLNPEQLAFLEEKEVCVEPVCYRYDELSDKYIAGWLFCDSNGVSQPNSCNLSPENLSKLPSMEEELLAYFKEVAINTQAPIQLFVNTYYF